MEQFLSQYFLHSLSNSPTLRHEAESLLLDASEKPNYSLAVARLVGEPSINDQIPLAAAINLKNHLRGRWPNAIPEPEKEQIKLLMVSLMLSSGVTTRPKIQSQLSEALAFIGNHDFPKSWPALLPQLVSGLQKASSEFDYASINGILATANSLFKKFRYEYKSNDLLLDLKYCLDYFAAPLLQIFVKTAALIESGSVMYLDPLLFESQRLCCRIFYSLNFQDLPFLRTI